MDHAKLVTELKTDPLGLGYATMTDMEAAASLNAPTRTKAQEGQRVNERELYARLGPQVAEPILQKLEGAAAVNPVLKRAVKWLAPEQDGIDLGHYVTRAMLDTLTGTVLTAEEVAALKGLGESPCSRREELGLSADENNRPVSAGDVAWTRANVTN